MRAMRAERLARLAGGRTGLQNCPARLAEGHAVLTELQARLAGVFAKLA